MQTTVTVTFLRSP